MPGDLARRELAGTRFADVRWVPETGSTNADALRLARDGAPEGVVLVADHQTAGRGRAGRTWTAPPGASLLMTVLLRPPAAIAGLLTMAVGMAACVASEVVAGVSPGLKWPNDLVAVGEAGAADRKLAGVLAEADWPARSEASGGWSEPSEAERVVVVVGIGLNVNWGGAFPDEVRDIAVALDELAGHEIDRESLLTALLVDFDARYRDLLESGDPGPLLAEYRQRSATIGRQVRVDLGVSDIVGTAADITSAGHLLIDRLDGERQEIAVGDVVHLRNA